MSYELILVPPNYKKQTSANCRSSNLCVACMEDEVELVDEFLNVAGMPHTATDFESIFSICPNCGTGELQLVNAKVDFSGPVWIGWK